MTGRPLCLGLVSLTMLVAHPALAKRLTAARRRASEIVVRDVSARAGRTLTKLQQLMGYEKIPLARRFVDGALGRDATAFAERQAERLTRALPRRPSLGPVIAELREAARQLRGGALNAAPNKGRALPRYRFDEQRYRQHLRQLTGEQPCRLRDRETGRSQTVRLDDRYAANPGNKLPQTASYLRQYYEGLGLQVELQPFEDRGRREVNVVVTIPGRTRETIVVGAHYDSAFDSRAKRDRAPGVKKVAPGADDNASGVAALMEAGLALRSLRPERTIKLVHFCGEEQPGLFAGSRAYVRRAVGAGEKIAAAFIVDAIAYNTDGRSRIVLHTERRERSLYLGSEIARAASQLRTRLRPVGQIPEDGGEITVHDTDSHPFTRHGVPAVFVNEDFHWRVGIHDRFDQTRRLDLPYAGRIIRATLEAVASVARPAGPDYLAR
jgi:hypothetical protein